MFNRLILAAAIAGTAFSVQAMKVQPLVSTFAPSHKSGVLTITNTDSTEKDFQVIAKTWTVVDGKQVLTNATSDQIYFKPSVITLAPGAKQVVRYIQKNDASSKEVAYRITVEEIPREITLTKSGIQNVFSYNFPWIWRASNAQPILTCHWDGGALVVENTGTATAQLVNITAGATIAKGLQGYVLPGEKHRFELGAKGAPKSVSAVVNGKTVELDIR